MSMHYHVEFEIVYIKGTLYLGRECSHGRMIVQHENTTVFITVLDLICNGIFSSLQDCEKGSSYFKDSSF